MVSIEIAPLRSPGIRPAFALAWQRAAHAEAGPKKPRKGDDMDTAPAVFAGTVFGLFGAGLLLWTVTRITRQAPVAEGAGQTAMVLAVLFGAVSLFAGVWSFLRI